MKKLSKVLLAVCATAIVQVQAQTGSFTKTPNTKCEGAPCDYTGPSIMINEIMISPSSFDGSLSGTDASQRGEWIELYNPNLCEPVDISCYYLGSAAQQSFSIAGEAFQIPNNTIVPPGGFAVIRGDNAANVPAALLVANGGNTVEVTVPPLLNGDGICIYEDPGSGIFPMPNTAVRLWFPNAGGWFAFYDSNGVPQDAISWGSEAGIDEEPCVASHSSCNSSVSSLDSYTVIPAARKENVYSSSGGVPNSWGSSIRRVPDGGAWVKNGGSTPTQGTCNATCATVSTSSCDGTATVNVTGGSGNYSYSWDDSESQITQTATGLCAGTYNVTVTDNTSGAVNVFVVDIEDLVPDVTLVVNEELCNDGQTVAISDIATYSPIAGAGETGEFSGTGVVGSNFDVSVSGDGTHSITYEFTDENGCTNLAVDDLIVHPNPTFTLDVVNPVCGASDGEITVIHNIGTAPYTYSIDNGNTTQTTPVFDDLSEGSYTIIVTDANGCTNSMQTTLNTSGTNDPSFTLEDYCEGENNSAANIATPGGEFSFVPAVTDGATINPTTGAISNGVGGTTYTVEYSLTGACPSSNSADVTVFPNPSFTLSHIDPTCGNSDGSITVSGLNGSSNYDLTYTFNGSVTGPQSKTTDAAGNIVLNNLPFGTYTKFIITTPDGCSSEVPANIELIQINPPIVTAPNDVNICLGESVTLTANNPDGEAISWDNGIVDGVSFTPTTVGSTIYTVTVTVSPSCLSKDEVTVFVHGHPDVNAGVDQIICEGESTVLTATGAKTFFWTNLGAGASKIVTPIANTVYEVTGTNEYGCEDTDEVEVALNPIPSPQFVGDSLEGCEPHTVNFSTPSNYSGATCLWDFGDGTTSTVCGDVSHTYTSSGTYSVSLTVTDAIGCSNTFTIVNYINVTPKPVASFSADPMVLNTNNTQVNFTNTSYNGTNFTWIFGDGSPNKHSYDATHDFPSGKADNYIVTLIASDGPNCMDTAQVIIKVEEDLIFYVPNTFTPDKDDYNEVFRPVFASGFDPQSYTLYIFNRWGELIFESHNTDIGWDGTYGVESSKVVKEGTYVWKIRIKETGRDKHNIYVGHINLLK